MSEKKSYTLSLRYVYTTIACYIVWLLISINTAAHYKKVCDIDQKIEELQNMFEKHPLNDEFSFVQSQLNKDLEQAEKLIMITKKQ